MKSVYRDKKWVYLQENREEGKAEIFDNGILYYPFIKRKAGIVNGVQYYDITTPRGECGPVFHDIQYKDKNNAIKSFLEEFEAYCVDNHIIAEYVKFDPWNDITSYLDSYYVLEEHGKLYCNNLQIDYFNDEYASKTRNHIRKAIKSGLTYTYDTVGNEIDHLLYCYNYTKEKNNISDYYEIDRKLIENYFLTYPNGTLITTIKLGEVVIGSALTVWEDDIAHHIYAGYDPNYNEYQASSYIIFLAENFVKERGCILFDQGGATPGSSLEVFKEEFVKKSRPYIYKLGKKIYDKDIYDILVHKTGTEGVSYFPAYRKK